MVYLPLCCNWHCQRTLKLIETDLSLITEAAGVRKVDDRLVLSLSLSLHPSFSSLCYFHSLLSLSLSCSVCGLWWVAVGDSLKNGNHCQGQLWQCQFDALPRKATCPTSLVPPHPLSPSPPTSHRKSCASWWFSDANHGAAKWFFPSCCLLLHLPLGPRRRRPPACHSVQWN